MQTQAEPLVLHRACVLNRKSRRFELFLATYRSTETSTLVNIWGREIYVVVGWWSSCLPSRKLSPIPASMYLNHPQCISTILNVSQPSSIYLNHPQCISTKLNVAQCSPTSLNGSLCWSTCQQDPRAGTSASLLDMRWNRDDRPFDSRQLLRLRLRTLVLANNKWISAR